VSAILAFVDYLVVQSVTIPARVNRAVFPLIHNSRLPSAYRPPSAEEACGSATAPALPAKVRRTVPAAGPRSLKTTRALVPSTQRYVASVANADSTGPTSNKHANISFMQFLPFFHRVRGLKHEYS
jgi:hypothetical protein